MAMDINFDNITLVMFSKSGKVLKIKRFKTPLRRLIRLKEQIEKIQRRYPRSWRFIKGVRESIGKRGRRIRNIAFDYSFKLANKVAEIAHEHKSIVVLENLNKLRSRAGGGSNFNKKLSLWLYHRTQFAIEYKLLEKGLESVKANPRNTSSKCPRCESKLVEAGHRALKCPKCGFTGDRNYIACINLFLKNLRCGVLGVTLNAPKPDATPSGMQGKRDGGMKTTNINPYKT